jgi:hypothetical protein
MQKLLPISKVPFFYLWQKQTGIQKEPSFLTNPLCLLQILSWPWTGLSFLTIPPPKCDQKLCVLTKGCFLTTTPIGLDLNFLMPSPGFQWHSSMQTAYRILVQLSQFLGLYASTLKTEAACSSRPPTRLHSVKTQKHSVIQQTFTKAFTQHF